MRKTKFVKFLNELDVEELKEELTKLYGKSTFVKNYYAMELGDVDDRKALFDKAKKKISNLYSRRKTRSRISKVNTLLKDIAAISIFEHELADLYLHHAEVAADHINYYGWPRDPDLNHLKTSFEKAVDHISSSQSKDTYQDRVEEVIEKLYEYDFFMSMLSDYKKDNLF